MSTFRCRALLRSRSLWVAVAVAAALLSLALSDTVHAQEVGRLVGNVVDHNGEPVVGAAVTLANEEMGFEATMETDDSGRFVRTGLRPGEVYQLHVEAADHMPVDEEVQVGIGSNEITVTLRGGAAYARGLFNEGAQAYNARDFQTAADRMATAVEILEREEETGDEVYVEALTILGSANLQLRQLDASMEAYQKIAELAPDDFRGFWGAGLSAMMKGEFETAVRALETAVELDPTHAFAQFALGQSLVESERYDEAIEHLETAVELNSTIADAHQQMGNAYVRMEELAKAVEQYELYLEKVPDAPNRQEVEQYIGQLREAIEAQEQ